MRLAAYRAAARIARRQARRARWRSLLVVALIGLPIAPLAMAAVVIKTGNPTREERVLDRMGTAEALIDSYNPETFKPDEVQAMLPSGTRLLAVKGQSVEEIHGGSYVQVMLEEPAVPADLRPVRGMFRVTEGRFPRAAGEAAATRHVLDEFGVGIGGVLRLQQFPTPLHVVGVAVRPESLGEPLALVGPGTLEGDADGFASWLIDLPPGMDPEATLRALDWSSLNAGYATRDRREFTQDQDGTVAMNASFGITAVAMFGVGLIAAAAFVVGARRQLRTLGLVGAAGGEPRHVKAIVLFGGVILGLVGSLAGTLLGIAGTYALHPYMDEHIGRIVGPIELPVPLLIAAVLLGTLAGTVAAYAPARSAAKLSTVDALAGRTRPPRRSGRLARRGMVLVAVGTAVVALATRQRSEKGLGGGLIVMLVGFLLAIPLLVDLVGKAAGRLPTSFRLAARQTGRYGRRTGAAMAAVTLALALPVAVSSFTLSQEAKEAQEARLGKNQLLVDLADPNLPGAGPSADLLKTLKGLVPGAIVAPLRPAIFTDVPPDAGSSDGQEWSAYVQGPVRTYPNGVGAVEGGVLMIGTPDLLRAMHAERGIPALLEGKVVAIGLGTTDHGRVALPPDANPIGNEKTLEAAEVPAFFSDFPAGLQYLISANAAAKHGMAPGTFSEALLSAPSDLTEDQIRQAKRAAAASPGTYVLSEDDLRPPRGEVVRGVLTGAGSVVALAIVAVVVALVASESRRDHAIMVAVGAGPGIRRRVVGAGALLLSLLAAILAVPAGFLPVIVVQWVRAAPYPFVVPWQAFGAVLVAVPILSGLGAAAVSREPKALRLLQPAW